jgi:hypothetical protein
MRGVARYWACIALCFLQDRFLGILTLYVFMFFLDFAGSQKVHDSPFMDPNGSRYEFHRPMVIRRLTENLHSRLAGVDVPTTEPPPLIEEDSDDSLDAHYQEAKAAFTNKGRFPVHKFTKRRPRADTMNSSSQPDSARLSLSAVNGVPVVGSSLGNVRATKIEHFEIEVRPNLKLPLDWASAKKSLVVNRRSMRITDYLDRYKQREYMTQDEILQASQILDSIDRELERKLKTQKVPDWARGGGGFGIGGGATRPAKRHNLSKLMSNGLV